MQQLVMMGVPALVSLSSRQLARMARKIATEAMTIELAAERGDWETVHQCHGNLIEINAEYRAAYVNALVQGAHRPRPDQGSPCGG